MSSDMLKNVLILELSIIKIALKRGHKIYMRTHTIIILLTIYNKEDLDAEVLYIVLLDMLKSYSKKYKWKKAWV